MSVLNAAEEWGRPPYELMLDTRATMWLLRRQELSLARADAQKYFIDKAKRELGYEPTIGIEEGLRRTGVWYIENNYI